MSNPLPEHLKNKAGRPKGSQNKITRAVKDVISSVADSLGGELRLVQWVMQDPANEKAFWTQIYPKLLPLTLSGDKDAPLGFVAIERRIVNAQD